MKRRVEALQHGVARQRIGSDGIELFLHIGGKIVIHHLGKVLGEEISDELTTWGRYEFTFGGARFFGGGAALNLAIGQCQYGSLAFLAFAFTPLHIAACLDGIDNRCVGARPTNAKVFELLYQ